MGFARIHDSFSSMGTFLRTLASFFAVLLTWISLLGCVIFGSLTAAMGVAWFENHRFAPGDVRPFLVGVGGTSISVLAFVLSVFWRRKRDPNSFRLRTSASGKSERFLTRWTVPISLVAFTVVAFSTLEGSPSAKFIATVIGVFIVQFGIYFIILIHELGHATAGWLLGYRMEKIQVGTGRVLWRNEAGDGIRFEWRLNPGAGLVVGWPQYAFASRYRKWLFVAAGPIASIALVLVLLKYVWVADFAARAHHLPGLVMDTLCYWGIVVAIGNLIPHLLVIDGVQYRSDGYHLLTIPRRAKKTEDEAGYDISVERQRYFWRARQHERQMKEIEDALVRYPEKEGALFLEKGYLMLCEGEFPEAARLLETAVASKGLSSDLCALAKVHLASACAAMGDIEKARALTETILSEISAEKRLMILAELALIPVTTGVPVLLPKAMEWCAEALKASPNLHGLLVIQAALWVEQADYQRGETALRRLVRGYVLRDVAAFYLALCARRSGAAERQVVYWQVRANRWTHYRWLLRRMELELGKKQAVGLP